MPEDLEETMKKAITESDRQLKKAAELIEKLRRAGEDVSELQRTYQATRMRVDRYKRAFGV